MTATYRTDPIPLRDLGAVDVAVVGAGQSGLAAGQAVRQAGLEVLNPGGLRRRGWVLAVVLRQPHPVLPGPVLRPTRDAAARSPEPVPNPGRDHRLPAKLRHPVRPTGPHPQQGPRCSLGRTGLPPRYRRREPADRPGSGRGVRRLRPSQCSRPFPACPTSTEHSCTPPDTAARNPSPGNGLW